MKDMTYIQEKVNTSMISNLVMKDLSAQENLITLLLLPNPTN
jgi:hypothetical protein